jgi:hypothetical protein
MPLGYDGDQRILNIGDTAELYAYLYDKEDAPESPDEILAVSFIIQKPNGDLFTIEGEVGDDNSGYLQFTDTDIEGSYVVVAQFTLGNGSIKSIRSDFIIENPFAPDILTLEDEVSTRVWRKLEDLFDSSDGGPWMRDMTLAVFSPSRVQNFIEEALFDINVYNPPTHFNIDKFATPINNNPNPDITLLVQGTLIAVIRHLMRSYTEQPLPTGGQVTYEDRRDYLQRWGTIYQIEFQHYDHLVKMWKRQFLGLNTSKQLISNKSGRNLPAPLRTRGINRGYY